MTVSGAIETAVYCDRHSVLSLPDKALVYTIGLQELPIQGAEVGFLVARADGCKQGKEGGQTNGWELSHWQLSSITPTMPSERSVHKRSTEKVSSPDGPR